MAGRLWERNQKNYELAYWEKWDQWNMIIERRISESGSRSSGSSGRSAERLGRRLRMACRLLLLQRDPVAESAEHGRREQPLPPLPPDV